MIRTQIQLPDTLYQEIRRVANKQFLWQANFMLDILKKVYKIDI